VGSALDDMDMRNLMGLTLPLSGRQGAWGGEAES
jgi:hypothetical protein